MDTTDKGMMMSEAKKLIDEMVLRLAKAYSQVVLLILQQVSCGIRLLLLL